ncbi:MAG: hypothetical protein IT369_18030 [Candidatus Latescibacteria bacterium]|nr:hypothetical protein [Candidatus Latescibacterota bacterium]
MIRIHLQPRSGRLLPILLLGLGVFALSFFGLSYLSHDEHLILPEEMALLPPVASDTPAVPAEAAAEAPAAVPAASETTAVNTPGTEPPVPPPAEVSAPSQPAPEQGGPAKASKATAPPAGRPAPARAPSAAVPAAGPMCLRILQLHERLPAVVRCTSLSGNAAGEYTIEGTVPSGDFPQLIEMLDLLKRSSSQANLFGGMAGKKEGDYGFTLHGQFAPAAPLALAPLESSQASALFTQAAALARKSKLDSVRVGAPLFTPTGKGVVDQRQKLWATGSYQQLKGFVETLVRQQPQLRLEEVMLVSRYKGEAQWKQAQFYAVLSTAVRAAR